MFAQSEGVNGVTGKQERGESSEDVCVVATGSNTVQGANPWWEAGTWLPAGAASVTPITGHSELQHTHTHRVNKHPPPIWLLQKAWAC